VSRVRAVSLDLWYTAFLRTPALDRSWEASRREALSALIRPKDPSLERWDGVVGTADRELREELGRSGRNPDTVSPSEYLGLVAQRTGGRVAPPPDEAHERYSLAGLAERPPIVNPGLPGFLERAARSGLPVLLITNTHRSGESLRRFFARHDGTRFDAIVTSCEVGVRKPDPAIFRSAAKGVGLSPPELLHVGDRFDCDVAGARAAGMGTALFTGYWAKYPPGSEEADARDRMPAADPVPRVRDLEALFRLIDG